MVYPRNSIASGTYLCAYLRTMDEKTQLPAEKWHCIVENTKDVCQRHDLGELFLWISEQIYQLELDSI